MAELTDRQQRELDYHRERAEQKAVLLAEPFSFDVLDRPRRRWWNAYWSMYAELVDLAFAGKRVLVVGCGFGEDAIRVAKLGAEVHAFDLSPESVDIAKQRAAREGVHVSFSVMPAERLRYDSGFFDLILACDILHHVAIDDAVEELNRVAKPDATWVINEIYSHSWTERVRRSRLVERWLYPRMQRLIYGPGRPYITADERKLSENDIRRIIRGLIVHREKHFNCLVMRVIPASVPLAAELDRLMLKALKPFGRLLAGRVLIVATGRH